MCILFIFSFRWWACWGHTGTDGHWEWGRGIGPICEQKQENKRPSSEEHCVCSKHQPKALHISQRSCTSAIGPCASATLPCTSATGPCASATGPCASPRGSRRQQVSRRRSKGIGIQQMKRQVALLQQLLDLQIQQQNLQCAFTPRPLPNISTPPSTGRSIFGMVGTPSPLWFLLFYQWYRYFVLHI